jgi:hypothetical protein
MGAHLKKYKSGIIELKMTPESLSAEYFIAIRIEPADVRGWE